MPGSHRLRNLKLAAVEIREDSVRSAKRSTSANVSGCGTPLVSGSLRHRRLHAEHDTPMT